MNRISSAISMLFGGVKTVSATLISTWQNVFPTFAKPSYRKNVSFYTVNELIYACIEITSDAASQIRMNLKRKDTDEYAGDHPLNKLIKNPNRFMSEFDLFKTILTFQLLAGRCVLEKERNNAGDVIGLYPLRPDWLKVVPSKTEVISGFMYGPEGTQTFIPYRDTIDLPLRDPKMPFAPYNPIAPVSVAYKVIETDISATEYIRLVFEKGGIPPGILKTKQKLLDNQVKSIRARWAERYGGINNWLEPAVLDSDAEYQKIGQSIEEMGFGVLDKRNESRICMVLRIPPILAGAFVGIELSSYDNYLTARKAWWQDSLLPRFWFIRDRIWLEMGYEYADLDQFYLEIDISNVFALQEDVDLVWRRAADAFRTGGITVNMYMQMIGLPNIGPQGDIFLRPLAYVEVPMKTPKLLNPGDLSSDRKSIQPNFAERRDNEQQFQDIMEKELSASFKRLKKEIQDNGVEAVLAERD